MTSENARKHNRAMAETWNKIQKATGDERKELLTQFYGSASVGIDELYPGRTLGYRFATKQQDIINTKEITL